MNAHDMEHRMQLALARAEKAEMTLRSIGDGVLTTDANGMVNSMNRIAEQLTGWTSEDAVGIDVDKVFRIVDELNDEAVENPVLKCLRLDQTVSVSHHTALVTRNGHRVAIDDTAAPIRDADGLTIGVVIVFHDVSHERNPPTSVDANLGIDQPRQDFGFEGLDTREVFRPA